MTIRQGGTSWIDNSAYYSYGMMFVNGWDLNLKANESKTLDLLLYINISEEIVNDIRWQPEVNINDYEVGK